MRVLLAVTALVLTLAPAAQANIAPGDGGNYAWCLNGVVYTYVQGVGYVPIGRC